MTIKSWKTNRQVDSLNKIDQQLVPLRLSMWACVNASVCPSVRPSVRPSTNGVVADVCGRRAEVDDGRGGRAGGGERVHVSHHVVSPPRLLVGREVEVDVRHVRLHLGELRVRDAQPQPLQHPA